MSDVCILSRVYRRFRVLFLMRTTTLFLSSIVALWYCDLAAFGGELNRKCEGNDGHGRAAGAATIGLGGRWRGGG